MSSLLGEQPFGDLTPERPLDLPPMRRALGDFIGERPVSAFIHPAGLPINTSEIEVLRRPVESAEYASHEYRRLVKELGLRQSMGSMGSCYDTAAAESFFGLLKAEIGTMVWESREAACADIFRFVELSP